MMETATFWVTVFGVIVIPLAGWIFNSLITEKINKLTLQQKDDRDLFFKRFDEEKEHIEDFYVRKDMYDQAMRHNKENEEANLKSILSIFSGQFAALEANMKVHSNDIKELENKIDSIKDLINSKMKNKEGG